MNCERVRGETMTEAYLTGRLSEQEREAFELHYLECNACFAELEAMRAVQGALRSMPRAAASTPTRRVWQRPLWLLAAAALVIAVVAIQPWTKSPSPQVAVAPKPAANSYGELARFDPPPFQPSVLRGPQEPWEPAFRDAMAYYTRRDWRGCQSALNAVASKYPQAIGARYYLGVCALLANDVVVGEAALRDTILSGDNPYLEEAHFYLAKALLARGDAAGARAELRKTIAMGGDLEQQASALAARIP
jgi:hypothetical protein